MRLVRVSKSASISAPPRAVYSLIADYRGGQPGMLPRRYLRRLEVELGGSGAGTIIRYAIRLFGTTRRARAEITEPKPGEVLVETDLATGARTTFVVVPRAGGRESEVTIETEWTARGLRGWFERMIAPSLLRRIYAEELAQLGTLFAAGSSAEEGGAADSTPGRSGDPDGGLPRREAEQRDARLDHGARGAAVPQDTGQRAEAVRSSTRSTPPR